MSLLLAKKKRKKKKMEMIVLVGYLTLFGNAEPND
jgi:hypothetical protein